VHDETFEDNDSCLRATMTRISKTLNHERNDNLDSPLAHILFKIPRVHDPYAKVIRSSRGHTLEFSKGGDQGRFLARARFRPSGVFGVLGASTRTLAHIYNPAWTLRGVRRATRCATYGCFQFRPYGALLAASDTQQFRARSELRGSKGAGERLVASC